MEVHLNELSQASRFAVMQYVAMLRRMPEGTLEERYNNGDAIVLDGVGTVPFPHAHHYVQGGSLSTAYNPRAGMQSPSVLSPSKSNVNRFPPSGGNPSHPEKLPSIVPAERRMTIAQMDLLLKAVGGNTSDCITTNDYAVRLYQSLDRQFDLSADISGAVTKLRRPFGVPFQSGSLEHKIRDKIKGKLGATDGSPSSLADAQKRIVKLQDRVRDMSETIERLRGVKADIEAIQSQVKVIRETCAQAKQTTRFQFLDMQDYLSDQIGRFKSIVGVDALRSTGVSTVGTINASRKAILEEEIRKMKEENPLRDAASVLRMTLECAAGDMRRIIRAPLDPSKPVADDSDDEDGRGAKGGAKGGKHKGNGAAPRSFQPNCVQQAIKREIRLPKVELAGGNWDVLKTYDKAGPELDLLNNTRSLLKYLHQMQKLMGQWHVDHSQSTSTINGLKHEIESLTEQLEAAKNAVDVAPSNTNKSSTKSNGDREEKAARPSAAAAEPGSPMAPAPSKPSAKANNTAASKTETKSSGGKKLGRKASNAAMQPKPASPVAAAAAATEVTATTTADADEGTETVTEAPSAAVAPTPDATKAPDAVQATDGDSGASTMTPETLGQIEIDATGPTRDDLDASEVALAPPPASTLPMISAPASPTGDRPMTAQSTTSDVPSLSKFRGNTDDAMRPLTSTLDSISGSIHATTSTAKASPVEQQPPATRPKQKGGSGEKPLPQPRAAATRANKAKLTSAALADQVSSNGSATPRRDDVLSNPAATPPPSQRATPRPEPTPEEPPGPTGPTLAHDDVVRIQGIFLEMSAAGVPQRLHRLLIELFHILCPGDPRIAVLREAVDDAAERVMQTIALPLGNALENTPAEDVAAEAVAPDELEGSARNPTAVRRNVRGAGGRRASNASPGAVGGGGTPSRNQEPSLHEGTDGVGLGTADAQPTQAGTPLNPSQLALPLASTPVTRAKGGAVSCVMHATTTSPKQSSLLPRSMLPGRTGAASVELQELEGATFGRGERVSALPTAFLGAGGATGGANAPHPLAQIRQLRRQYTSNTGTPQLPVADALDPSELPEDDALFAKRKHKFVELTRKLLADLPVMKREHGAHPLLDTDVGEASPPLLFAPAKQFPTR